MNKLLVLCCLCLSTFAQAQEYNLESIITLATSQSPRALQAKTALNARYWAYRNYQSNYLPQLALSSVAGNYYRSIDNITQPDGSFSFRPREVANSSVFLSLSQAVAPTGGTLSLSSGLNRIDNFTVNSTQFTAIPASIGFDQPLLAFNNLRWERRIQPLLYEEAKRRYNEEMEQVVLRAINLYYNVLESQINQSIADVNVANNDTLFKIAQGRYNLGKIAENELLQMELAYMRAKASQNQSEAEMQRATLELRLHLGYSDNQTMKLAVPEGVFPESISEVEAIEQAQKNRSLVIGLDRRLIEAKRGVAQAKGETGLRGNLQANLGLNQTAESINSAFNNPLSQQQIQFSLTTPIIDWGRTKSRRRTAEANLDLEKSIINQETQSFAQQISLAVNNFNLSKSQLEIGRKGNDIAAKRYEITKQRYLIGKIGITDLNIAQQERDAAKRDFIASLRNYYLSYYNLRSLTLYNFVAKAPISYEVGL